MRKDFLFSFLIILFSIGVLMIWGVMNAFYLENGNLTTFSWIVNSDWMMHITQVQNFSALPLYYVATHHPLYSGDILSYPFFVNWFSGILLFFTNNLVFSMVFPMIFGMLFFVYSVCFLLFTLSGTSRQSSLWVVVLAFFLFFFSGGFQWLDVWEYCSWSEWGSLHDYLFDKQMVELGYYWKSVYLTTLLPQRSYVWGMAMGAFAFALFVKNFLIMIEKPLDSRFFQRLSFVELRSFFFIGLLLGTVSVLHTHSFFFLFLLFLGFLVFYFRYFFSFCAVGFGAFITGIPFVVLLMQKQSGISEISLYPLAMGAEYMGSFFSVFFHFWHANWGIFFWILFLFALPAIFQSVFAEQSLQKIKFLQVLFFIVSVLFVVFSLVKMQSNPWDNTKLWLWCSLFFSFFVSSFFVFLWKQYHLLGKIVAGMLFFFSIFSGIIMLVSGFNDEKTIIFSQQDIVLSEKVKTIIRPTDIILTSDYFHLPITALVPKQTFLGYRGWIASYGMDTSKKTKIMECIYAGCSDAVFYLRQENITYVLLDDSIRSMTKVNDEFFQTQMQLVADFENWGKLYRVKK